MRRQIMTMLTLFAVSLPGAALAGAREDTLAGISRCNAIPDDRGFLDCIDGAARQLRARLALPAASATRTSPVLQPATGLPAPQSTVSRNAYAPPASRKRGWLARVFGSAPGKPALHMAFYTFDGRGMFTVTFKDGEVWRQMDSDGKRAHWRDPAPNYGVTVKEGIFGASILEVDGDQTHYMVQRLR
jgi:hypothetical protein